jgi:hypothetical protein
MHYHSNLDHSTNARNLSFDPPLPHIDDNTTGKGVQGNTAGGDKKESIRHEFIEGSAIAPDVFDEAVQFLPDVEFDPVTREVIATPIADALNWHYTRFTHEAKPDLLSAAFVAESGEVWQAKVFGLGNEGRSGQYYAPVGNGDKPYFPPVPVVIRK